MEYYIMKLYYEKNAESNGKSIKKNMVVIYTSIITMILTGIGMLVSFVLCSNKILPFLLLVIFVGAIVTMYVYNFIDEKRNIEFYENSYSEKLSNFGIFLKDGYGISSRNKLEELMMLYQNKVDKITIREKKRNKVFATVVTAFTAFFSLLLNNLEETGIGFYGWMELAVFCLLIVSGIMGWVYCFDSIDSTKEKYEDMLNMIKDLILIKY